MLGLVPWNCQPMTPAPRAKPKRRTARRRSSQAQRREATRTRILEATLACLARYGYAGTGVAQVVAKARVSRGAWSHHFRSMDALMLESAQYLMQKVYARLGAVLQALGRDGNLERMIETAWREFYASEVNEIYLELLVASRRHPQLAAKLGSLARPLEQNLGGASMLNFAALPGAVNGVVEMMHLNRWLLRGIALDAPLLPAGAVPHALAAWSRLASTQMQRRSAVTQQAI